jgi:hypothetical protein
MEPRHIGYRQKAVVVARMINALQQGLNVGIRKKRRNVVHIVPTTANYLRFLAFLVSGAYAPVVLMPRLLRYELSLPFGSAKRKQFFRIDDYNYLFQRPTLIPHYLGELMAFQVKQAFHPTLHSMCVTAMPSICHWAPSRLDAVSLKLCKDFQFSNFY